MPEATGHAARARGRAGELAGAAARAVRQRVDDYRHRAPALRLTKEDGPPRVLFLTPDWARPSGGIRTIYRHVDILVDAGIRAAVLHRRPGFRCTWFDNNTPVMDVRSSPLRGSDLLVVPEVHGPLLSQLPPSVRHVVFNQSGHLTWARDPSTVSRHYQSSRQLLAVVTVSQHSTDLLHYAFPGLAVHRVHLSVDERLHRPMSRDRGRQISYMPRRARADATQVLEILRCRGILDGWSVVPIDGMDERAVAHALSQSTIFLSFSHQEGFGLPAAEAMANACYVVGSHGFGGQELFRGDHSSPVAPGDVLGFAQAVEQVIRQEEQSPGWCAARGELASRFVLSEYSRARERDDVIGVYRPLVDSA